MQPRTLAEPARTRPSVFSQTRLTEVGQQNPEIGQIRISVAVQVARTRTGCRAAEVGEQDAQVGQIRVPVTVQVADAGSGLRAAEVGDQERPLF